MTAVAQFDRGTVAHPGSARGTYWAAVGAEWTKLRTSNQRSGRWSSRSPSQLGSAPFSALRPSSGGTDSSRSTVSCDRCARRACHRLRIHHPLDSHHVLGHAASAHRCHGQSNGARSGGARRQPGRLLHCFRLGPGHPARQTCRRLPRRSTSAACCCRRCVVPHVRRHHRLLDRDCPAAHPRSPRSVIRRCARRSHPVECAAQPVGQQRREAASGDCRRVSVQHSTVGASC